MFPPKFSRQQQLAEEMFAFAQMIPKSCDLEWVKEKSYLYHFEAERFMAIYGMLTAAGINQGQNLRVLDFGYLHGLIPEFLHRQFPNMAFTVCDHPESSVFSNESYLKIITQRDYLKLIPIDLRDIKQLKGTFDLVILGEIIEHLDPTVACQLFCDLKPLIAAQGMLLITTPNDSALLACLQRLRRKSPVMPPFPDSMMQYPHIHFWSIDVLSSTLSHFGLSQIAVRFSDGKEGMAFSNLNANWGSLFYQISMRLAFLVTRLISSWRGFFVALYRNTSLQP